MTAAVATSHARRQAVDVLPVIGAIAVIALQIMWPLFDSQGRSVLTIVIVVIFAATSVIHSGLNRGWVWTGHFAATCLIFAWLIELVGITTGFPFGTYSYGNQLGTKLVGVPVVVVCAWLMMAYPALVVSQRIARAFPGHRQELTATAIGALALTSWDFFLDPQMVAESYWRWSSGGPEIPGIPGIPATNFLGWLIGSFVLMLTLNYLPKPDKRTRSGEAVPAILWVWTWIGGIIANAFFLDRGSVALVGGVAMGIITVPYLWIVWRER